MEVLHVNDLIKGIKEGSKDFSNYKIYGAELRSYNLKETKFQNACLEWVTFNGAKLESVDFAGSEIMWCNFANAQMTDVSFKDCKIEHCFFYNIPFKNTTFHGAEIKHTGFLNSNMGGADFTNVTRFNVGTSWEDASEEYVDMVIDAAKQANLPSHRVKRLEVMGKAIKTMISVRLNYGKVVNSVSKMSYVAEIPKDVPNKVYAFFSNAYTEHRSAYGGHPHYGSEDRKKRLGRY